MALDRQKNDFGKELIKHVLIQKGHEVDKVDEVGADLTSKCSGKRYAISVKSRLFRIGSAESQMYTIEDSNIEKLKRFSISSALSPLFSLVVCLADLNEIYVFILPVDKIDEIFKNNKTKLGYSLNFRDIHIQDLKNDKYIRTLCWGNVPTSELSASRVSGLRWQEIIKLECRTLQDRDQWRIII